MYFFRAFIKELRRDMKLNPKKSGLAKMLDVNHIVPRAKTGGGDLMSQSEIDEDEDKFEDLDTEIGETDLKVDLPDEECSSLLGADAHNAPTL